MSRILLVAQETGGVGKSTAARALAEAVPDAPIYEIESSKRLVELGERVEHFPIRAKPSEVRETGGEAALSEYDEVVNGLIADQDRMDPAPSHAAVGRSRDRVPRWPERLQRDASCLPAVGHLGRSLSGAAQAGL